MLTATKVRISGVIVLKTGLHIGGDSSFAAIGAVDSPVVRDPLTQEPIIPGSSLKGKMRTLLARDLGSVPARGVKGFSQDPWPVLRLFGSSDKGSDAEGTGIQQSRLMFKDAFLQNKDELSQTFEAKFENTIDRLTAVANPRQIERVVRGARFDLEIIYNVERTDEVEEDFQNIQRGLDLLRYDYLGGGGTRGSGRVDFEGLKACVVTGDKGLRVPELV